MKRASSIFVIFACVLFGLFSLQHLFINQEETSFALTTSQASIRSQSNDVNGVSFQLHMGEPYQLSDGHIMVEGLEGQTAVPGSPALPYYSTFLILPPNAQAVVNLTPKTTQQIALQSAIPSVAYGQFDPEQDTTVQTIYQPSATIYQKDALYPEVLYTVSEPMYYRDYRLVQLNIYPLRYNPVQQTVHAYNQIDVDVQFVGANLSQIKPAFSADEQHTTTVANMALNFEQGRAWRALDPQLSQMPTTPLPLNTDVYKFAINQDGIYEISYTDLANAGMDVDAINPQTIEMMYRGHSLAYQFMGDGDTIFEAGETIRFYGWQFTGPKAEEMFIKNNVVWLWAGGTPTLITEVANQAGQGHPVVTNYLTEETRAPENAFFATWTNDWDIYPNEPDAWYWDYVQTVSSVPVTYTYPITLSNPVGSGQDAQIIVEIQPRTTNAVSRHEFRTQINSAPQIAGEVWLGQANNNIVLTVPNHELIDGVNNVDIGLTLTAVTERWYLNRITAVYQRHLIATNNQLQFTDHTGGNQEFHIQGFNQDGDSALIWNISTLTEPVQIDMSVTNSSGSGTFTYEVGSTHPANSRFIATTENSILTASDLAQPIEQYTPQSLNPANGADWVAIVHDSLYTTTQILADHRANPDFGGLDTHIITIEDVINQYGYGLPLPEAIQNYMAQALGNWTVPPSYLTLVGDATHNPRNLDCLEGCVAWDANEENLVLTDLAFIDRYQGLIPTDYTFALVSGDDILPEFAVGRIAAKTATEAQNAIDKIILYEHNQQDPTTYESTDNMLFVSDNTDAGGDFCNESSIVRNELPISFEADEYCFLEGGINDVATLRAAMATAINDQGVSIVNYRGHGRIYSWGEEPTNAAFLDADDQAFWQNDDLPVIILSADCLDGYFAYPNLQGLGESFLKQPNTGSAAHWSSTGLGFTHEHTLLHTEFYNGVFAEGLTEIGSAIDYAKTRYFLSGEHTSEMFSFTLQGDPAMQVYRPDVSVSKTAVTPLVTTSTVSTDFVLEIQNNGVYPSQITLIDTLPEELTYTIVTPTVPLTVAQNGNVVQLYLLSPLARGETAVITMTTALTPDFIGYANNQVTMLATGLDVSPDDNSAEASIANPTVELLTFTATPGNQDVQLNWQTTLEGTATDFKIERAEDGTDFIFLTDIGLIPTQGDVGSGAVYTQTDITAQNGYTYTYRLVAVEANDDEVPLATDDATLEPSAGLATISLSSQSNLVQIDWATAYERDVANFVVQREINGTFITLTGTGNIPATGSSTIGATYVATDTTALNGETYLYRIIAVEDLGENEVPIGNSASITLQPSVELNIFTASYQNGQLNVIWRTDTELEVEHFYVQRAQEGQPFATLPNASNITAVGNATSGTQYQIEDETAVLNQAYTYKLFAVESNGRVHELATTNLTIQGNIFLPIIRRR